jgi:transposase
MLRMRLSPQPTDWREGRRLRAWELYQQGWSQKQIAAALGVSPGAVSQWIARAKAGGVTALRKQPRSGATPKLTQEQRERLPDLLLRGAEAFGFVGDVWTQQRIAAVIKREFGVSYHPDHIGRLLHAIGWSVQKPIERASERNDAAIERWRSKNGQRSKKAEDEGRTLVWIDEAGFYSLPTLVRTWAPIGEPPTRALLLSYLCSAL